jgi:hypothetical protein
MIVEYGGVRFSEQRLDGLDGGHPVIRILRSDIQKIDLRWGRQAARPLVQTTLGLGTLLIGGGAAIHLVLSLLQGTVYFLKADGLLTVLILLGVWLFRNALKKGYYLDVTTRRGREKVPFGAQAPITEILDCLHQASVKLGYDVSVEAGVHLAAAP